MHFLPFPKQKMHVSKQNHPIVFYNIKLCKIERNKWKIAHLTKTYEIWFFYAEMYGEWDSDIRKETGFSWHDCSWLNKW